MKRSQFLPLLPLFASSFFYSSISSQTPYKNYSTLSETSTELTPSPQERGEKTTNKKSKQSWVTARVFTWGDFSENSFVSFLVSNLTLNTTYSLLTKVGYRGNSRFYMAGPQIGVLVKGFHNVGYYRNLYSIISTRIEELEVSGTKDKGGPETVHLIWKVLVPLPELTISKSIKSQSVKINKNIVKVGEVSKLFNSKHLPLTADTSYYGNLLVGSIKHKYLRKLTSTMKYFNRTIPDYLTNLDILNSKSTKVFLTKSRKVNKFKSKSYLTISRIYESNLDTDRGYIRTVFDALSGIKLTEAFDCILDSSTFSRKIKDTKLTVTDGKLTKIVKYITFEKIFNVFAKFSRKDVYYGRSNPNIGVLDLETYNNLHKAKSEVFALGYATLSDREPKTFYITDDNPSLDSNYLVIKCIDSMLVQKYHNYFFYVHNLGKFDVVFIYKILKEFNLHKGEEYYILNTTFRDDVMLKLTISIKLSPKKYIKITLLDSLNILTDKLEVLSKDFEVGIEKGPFPYGFVNKDTFNYVGETPSSFHYKKISKNAYYESLYVKEGWDLKKETIKYLEKDIASLLLILEKFSSSLFVEYNLQMTEGLTISRLALNFFFKNYLKDKKIPLINKLQPYNFIRFGYYGGITEVYKPYGKNLNYYDVNSLYPYVALQSMPGVNCNYTESLDSTGLVLDNLFGFFHAQVKTNNSSYLGLLPIKTDKGLIFPNGEFEGVWSSEELKFARDNGYKIKVTKGYNFNRVEGVFSEYVNDLYKQKLSATGALRMVIKSLLNNLLGRFGMDIIKPITKSVNKEKLNYILSTRKVNSYHEITDNDYLISYNPSVDEEICMQHGLDYVKVLEKDNNPNIEKNIDVFKDVSIAISAMVTSYARIYMNKIKIEILNNGGAIYYSDTDSIVTNIDLETLSPHLVGKELGKFKLVHRIKEAFFISNKTYCLVLDKGKTKIVSKGVDDESLDLVDFKILYFDSKSTTGSKQQTIRNYAEGSVSIDTVEVRISSKSYTKRIKTYNEEGLWVNTQPLTINNVIKDITLYNHSNNNQ